MSESRRPEPDEQTRKRRMGRIRQARYKKTAKGILTDVRYEAKRRGTR